MIGAFEESLRMGNTKIAIEMVTPENCNAIDDDDDGIIENFCYYTKYDNTEDFLQLVRLGCQVGVYAASYASENGYINILREVISFYPEAVLNASHVAYEKNVECMMLLVETQIRFGFLEYRYSLSARRYHRHRDSVRSCAIHTMHAMYEMGRKDVGRIIARVVWASRSVTFLNE